jgi:putative SOS response-associated peptidase YedK
MCTLYRLATKTAEIARLFGAEAQTSLEAPLAIYPDRLAPVVGHGSGGRVLAEARWGVPPPAAGARSVVNVRNLASPFWRGALARPALRCLVPADDFCEWSDAADPATGRKRQHFFALATGTPLAFAGLVRPAPPQSEDPPRFAFLTTEPNAVVAPIHAKAMPVILTPEQWDPWMEGLPAEAFQHPIADEALRLLA